MPPSRKPYIRSIDLVTLHGGVPNRRQALCVHNRSRSLEGPRSLASSTSAKRGRPLVPEEVVEVEVQAVAVEGGAAVVDEGVLDGLIAVLLLALADGCARLVMVAGDVLLDRGRLVAEERHGVLGRLSGLIDGVVALRVVVAVALEGDALGERPTLTVPCVLASSLHHGRMA